jgi:hypothetical protein
MIDMTTHPDESSAGELRSKIVSAFYKQCIWARAVRTHFEVLFQSGEQRNQLMNETAKTFFHDLNWIMLEYLLLQQCKLTDPASSRKDTYNLTTNYVLSLDWTSDTKQKLAEESRILQKLREKILPIRNQMISHLDLNAGIALDSFKILNLDEDNAFWEHLQNFLALAFEEALPGESFELDLPMPEGDAGDLLSRLVDAVDYAAMMDTNLGLLAPRLGKRRFEDV